MKRNLWRLVQQYAASQVALSWIGNTDPEDWDTIRENAREMKKVMKKVCGKRKVKVS
jgi:hypothetical protein